jgi:hypothetical protein
VSRWLQTEPPVENTQLIRTGRESGPHGKSTERRGVGSVEIGGKLTERRGVGSIEMGEQVAESGPEPVQDCCREGEESQGYQAGIDPMASGLSCRACIDLASCSGGFLKDFSDSKYTKCVSLTTSVFDHCIHN